jgi:DNA-binding GntR family transcriptional regulator
LLRVVDGSVVCFGRHYFPSHIAEKFRPAAILDRAVTDVLCEITGMTMGSLEWTTEIIPATREVALPLRITPGLLVFSNTGTEYLSNDSPIQVAIMCYRIDRVKFQFAASYADYNRQKP